MLLETLTKSLADRTRLRILMLLADGSELCVCELTQSLELVQPKISRHLAILRASGLLRDRRAGLWVYYRLHPELPDWAREVIFALKSGSFDEALYREDVERLAQADRQNPACSIAPSGH